ncbi:MAG TPA: phosphotransferase [Candidatus Baltobacteraceae bacterium]|jgi:aminoglycoside phosphotransferase (APT) family kinase protein|nr:phosphotransferase [Candidatus Baltobacteraceae bacterium]
MTPPRPSDPWAPDIDIDAPLARSLVGAQFPQLGELRLEPAGEGWDNAAFLVNDAFIFRFPRRSVSAKLIARELRFLPAIAPRLPLPIPMPAFAGVPSEAYPWPFAGYRWLDGRELSSLQPADEAYGELAAALGGFLRALRGIDAAPLAEAGLPGDEIGRLDDVRMMPKLETRLRELHETGTVRDPAAILEAVEALRPIAPPSLLTVAHGDLYARHVLVDEAIRPTGIIDWGDLHLGDPAVDLAIVFSVIPPQARAAFFSAFGSPSEAAVSAARFRAIYHSAMVAHYGQRIGDADLLHIGVRGLAQALL